ncbi:hypothetical protein [Brevibacillus nitrificans]|uniref:hypothetical protein n=1 Tax=Brevibacillus nitrificans TaxID=651560 RepID=UPI0026049D40|nr:hypothetical protein [Brevibacillus nitrificans]
MGAYDTPSKDCPYCGTTCEADWVDVGVGMVQCGPYHCESCHASEIGPEYFDCSEYDNEKGRYVFKEGHPFSDKEIETGWYDPESKKISPYANTVNGQLVNHETAKAAYRMGLLDEKRI